MRHVYLAHPLSASTKEGIQKNIQFAKQWFRWACDNYYPSHCFNLTWVVNCEVYNDADKLDRERGMQRNYAHIARSDELWLVGPKITQGMLDEATYARRSGLSVYNLTGFEKPITARIDLRDLPVWLGSGMQQQILPL